MRYPGDRLTDFASCEVCRENSFKLVVVDCPRPIYVKHPESKLVVGVRLHSQRVGASVRRTLFSTDVSATYDMCTSSPLTRFKDNKLLKRDVTSVRAVGDSEH